MTASSGNVSYTGVGFTPTSILCLSAIHTTFAFSVSMSDSAKTTGNITAQSASAMRVYDQYLCLLYGATDADFQGGVISTYDADGFTITWTKAGSPTGTGSLKFLCFR